MTCLLHEKLTGIGLMQVEDNDPFFPNTCVCMCVLLMHILNEFTN